MKKYAGIGSRRTPENVLKVMKLIGEFLAGKNFVLRSGHADGADKAFEEGCDIANGTKEIYIPWKGFNGADNSAIVPAFTDSLEHFSSRFHPRWGMLTPPARKLIMRNSCQVFGLGGDDPVEFIVCWHNNSGGTMQAVRIAEFYEIPVINLAEFEANEAIDIIKRLIK